MVQVCCSSAESSHNIDSLSNDRNSLFSRGIKLLAYLAISIGLVLAGFLAYEMWWTNSASQTLQESGRSEILFKWSQDLDPPFADLEYTPYTPGEVFALMYIPRLREHVWGTPILEGVEAVQLASGIGHYPLTAQPGKQGNFVTFGHRTTHGQPFSNIERLQVGDLVIIRTQTKWYVYTLKIDQIVQPTDVWIMRSRPLQHSRAPVFSNTSLITLITCTPRHSTAQRWVWWGDLTEVRELSDSPL